MKKAWRFSLRNWGYANVGKKKAWGNMEAGGNGRMIGGRRYMLQFLGDYTEEERGVEEKEHLEENDPLRLIRESIINHKEELLDEISEKSQNTTLGA